ncbi:hypothetical protein KAR91_14390, partial [Candidatus Pacearchaeota archaeon]|nr:hypothetical protein [Candidatus Pacearchaeota archaeon]
MSHNKNWKAITIDWTALGGYDNLEIIPVCLTQRQVAVLKSLLIPAYWSTRWDNLTASADELDEFVTNIDNQLSGNDCYMTNFCEQVAACIAESSDVQENLVTWSVANNGTGGVGDPDNVLPESVREENLLPEEFTCDNDHRYGMAVGIVQAIHDATLEVFEKIEILTNPVELAAEIADNVPVVEAAGVAAEVILWVQETAYELYIAAWSDVVKDTIACEIFCLMID